MTPQQHAHAQALNEAHIFFGGHDSSTGAWSVQRERWIAARETELPRPAVLPIPTQRSTT